MSVNTKVKERYYAIDYCGVCGRRLRARAFRCKCGYRGGFGPLVLKRKQPGVDRWEAVK